MCGVLLFGSHVIAHNLDNSNDKLYEAKENLKHLDNIEFRLMDVYRDRWNFEEKEVQLKKIGLPKIVTNSDDRNKL